jgi:hypothetical protein
MMQAGAPYKEIYPVKEIHFLEKHQPLPASPIQISAMYMKF